MMSEEIEDAYREGMVDSCQKKSPSRLDEPFATAVAVARRVGIPENMLTAWLQKEEHIIGKSDDNSPYALLDALAAKIEAVQQSARALRRL